MDQEFVSHWHPNLTINLVVDQTNWVYGQVPQPLDECKNLLFIIIIIYYYYYYHYHHHHHHLLHYIVMYILSKYVYMYEFICNVKHRYIRRHMIILL